MDCKYIEYRSCKAIKRENIILQTKPIHHGIAQSVISISIIILYHWQMITINNTYWLSLEHVTG